MRWLILPIILAFFLLTSCRYGPVSKSNAVGIRDGYLIVTIDASTNCAKPGETVILRASVVNKTSQTFIVDLQDRPVFDLCIEAYGGYKKCWSDGKPLTTALTHVELKPGESRTIEMKWVAEPYGEFGAGGSFIDSSNVRSSVGANVVVGVEGNCPGQGMR